MPTPTPPVPARLAHRAVWIALVLLASAYVAAAAGWLAHAGGATPPTAALTAGGAFATTVLLGLAILSSSTDQA